MKDNEAHKIMRELRDAAVRECGNLTERIETLTKENDEDPNELTTAHLALLNKRYARKVEEAEALSIAVSKF